MDKLLAQAIAEQYFGIRATATQLPSERDRNFLLTDSEGEKFILKIANTLEEPAFLEAQNAVLTYLESRFTFCPRLVATTSGDSIASVVSPSGTTSLARVVRYLEGVPLASVRPHPPELLRDLGRKLGQLDRALAEFDHPAVHRDFIWDLANGVRVLGEHGPRIMDESLRALVLDYKDRFALTDPVSGLRRSVIHADANDYNVLVDPERNAVAGFIDFGDIVYSYTVGDLAVAIAYVVLDKADPLADASHVVAGYVQEYPLADAELDALWKLVLLRLCMSVCLAAYQQEQQPDNEYLSISQKSIAASLPRLIATDWPR